VQLFISYRREDTAGRAGRLFDALVSRFGARNVFQDVMAIAPGTDFEGEITAAIDRCDAVLVIIGDEWATLAGPAGRRLDEPDDYVRREVAAALSSGVPVVPVLVGGASMLSADELPEDLQPLAMRQAFTVRDDSWHQDVETLARRLRREDVVGRHPRRWAVLVAGATIAVVAVVAAVWMLRARGDSDGSATSSDSTAGSDGAEITGCPEPSESWSTIEVADAATATVMEGDARLVFAVRSAAVDEEEGRVFLEVEVRNESDPTSTQVPYYNQAFFRTLLVDGLSQGFAQCLTVEGNPNLYPAQRAVGLVGFDLTEDLAGKSLVLELLSGDPDITVT
jgi:TIR domain